jgi:hypothetical protein
MICAAFELPMKYFTLFLCDRLVAVIRRLADLRNEGIPRDHAHASP